MHRYTLTNKLAADVLLIVEPWAREYSVAPEQTLRLEMEGRNPLVECFLEQSEVGSLRLEMYLNDVDSFEVRIA